MVSSDPAGELPAHYFQCHCEVVDRKGFMNMNIVVYKIGACQSLVNLAAVMKSIQVHIVAKFWPLSSDNPLPNAEALCYVVGKASLMLPSASFLPCVMAYIRVVKCQEKRQVSSRNKAQFAMQINKNVSNQR